MNIVSLNILMFNLPALIPIGFGTEVATGFSLGFEVYL